MSNIKLNIQRLSAGSAWSSGITKSGIEDVLNRFNNEIAATQDAIRNYASVDAALTAGWSGTDCQKYLELFHTHAEQVCSDIDKYREAVNSEAQKIIAQWEEFQQNLIS